MIRHSGFRLARIVAVMTAVAMTFSTAGSARAQVPPLAPCPTGLAITTIAPTTAAPTTVTATVVPTLNLKAAAAADPQSFHLHYYVDVDPTTTLKPGTAIPSGDPKIIHSGSLSQDLGTLTPGAHTVWVVIGQFAHQACGGADGNVVAGKVTFTTAAAQAAPVPAPAKAGNGGLVAPTGSPVLPFALAALALLVVGGARIATARRD